MKSHNYLGICHPSWKPDCVFELNPSDEFQKKENGTERSQFRIVGMVYNAENPIKEQNKQKVKSVHFQNWSQC